MEDEDSDLFNEGTPRNNNADEDDIYCDILGEDHWKDYNEASFLIPTQPDEHICNINSKVSDQKHDRTPVEKKENEIERCIDNTFAIDANTSVTEEDKQQKAIKPAKKKVK